MLTERKRFNYMVNNGHNSHRKQYSTHNSSLKSSAVNYQEEPSYVQNQRGREDKENHKKV
jgi:hypothetical protein